MAFAQAIDEAADKYSLDPELVAAIIVRESSCNPWATRFEPRFFEKYIAGKAAKDLPGHVPAAFPTLPTERVHRATSWGLMQILGETARELGFSDDCLPALLSPRRNIDLGAKLLRKLIDRSREKAEPVREALLNYNGGADRSYPDRIFKLVESGGYKAAL